MIKAIIFDLGGVYFSIDYQNLPKVIVCSYSVGVNKPHPGIYKEALRRLNLSGKECIFIDDTEERLRPAQELGMVTIHFTKADDLKKELKDAGVMWRRADNRINRTS